MSSSVRSSARTAISSTHVCRMQDENCSPVSTTTRQLRSAAADPPAQYPPPLRQAQRLPAPGGSRRAASPPERPGSPPQLVYLRHRDKESRLQINDKIGKDKGRVPVFFSFSATTSSSVARFLALSGTGMTPAPALFRHRRQSGAWAVPPGRKNVP